MAAGRARPSRDDRTTALGYAIVIAFLCFVGVATFIQGGSWSGSAADRRPRSRSTSRPCSSSPSPTPSWPGSSASGYRFLRERSLVDALWSAATYAAVVAIAAAAVRAVSLPRLLGPALLALVFFVWDGVHGAPPAQRRDPRWIWQIALLVVLGAAVVAWNLALRG